MQRIDENTFIDDTLVTCAEYQLFIDEMREQGKYYQPDHWTSYQFPKGQAREPILGVRQSDATAFCEWLTNQIRNEWKFRLSTLKEANAFPMKSLGKNPLGYWIDGNDNFMWISSVPKNPRDLDLDAIARTLDLNRVRNLPGAHDLDALDLAHADNRNLDRNLASARDLFLALDLSFDHAITLALELARNLDLVLNRARNLDHARDVGLNCARNSALELARNLDLPLDSDRYRTLNLNLARDFDLDFDLKV